MVVREGGGEGREGGREVGREGREGGKEVLGIVHVASESMFGLGLAQALPSK